MIASLKVNNFDGYRIKNKFKIIEINFQFLFNMFLLNKSRVFNSSFARRFAHAWPEVQGPLEHFRVACKSLGDITMRTDVKNLRNRQRMHTIMSIDVLTKALTMPVTAAIEAHQRIHRRLHPFEVVVAELTMVSRVKAGKPSIQVGEDIFADYLTYF